MGNEDDNYKAPAPGKAGSETPTESLTQLDASAGNEGDNNKAPAPDKPGTETQGYPVGWKCR